MHFVCVIFNVVFFHDFWVAATEIPDPQEVQWPTIFIPILVRNKAHTLPTFFGCLERQDYPKERISIWIRSDHNEDNSTEILKEWVSRAKHLYHAVDLKYEDSVKRYANEEGPFDWTEERFLHLINLRQTALEEARRQWANYLFAIDADNFLENNETLKILISANKPMIAPMLESTTMYSNFWAGTNEYGYYRRTPEYSEILERNISGIFQVPMIHSTYMVDLQRQVSLDLQYTPSPEYDGDLDDMLIFAYSARKAFIPMYVINAVFFGSLSTPAGVTNTLEEDQEQMIFQRIEVMVDHEPMPLSNYISPPFKPLTKLGVDEIYLINLKRRPKRRERMIKSLHELSLNYTILDAVDGKQLTDDKLKEMGIDMLDGYKDPYHERILTKGEIGCFLSHYKIWVDVVEKNYEQVIVLEDDVRFEAFFTMKLKQLLYEPTKLDITWDLIYLGRKILNPDLESWVNGSDILLWPSYSYWTLGYILSQSGARKLVEQNPLSKMVPVDEYLPLMFDKHPEKGWKDQFSPRDLITFSVHPLLVYPTHYYGEPNYFSDTEASNLWESVCDTHDSAECLELKNREGRDDINKKKENDQHIHPDL
ncbi:procollagen galactosyltransferase 2-like isoform X2 [Anneissia japonica]|uniref:procollagen galactosyltransferase 2-like isoform X2 n=1 Tax=Anneissia japonica TaxID=1529436 RepID=UPI0014258EE4|nr:procollagen galactosyltransferase 2-like isoform X2 [Anneissia japonica]